MFDTHDLKEAGRIIIIIIGVRLLDERSKNEEAL